MKNKVMLSILALTLILSFDALAQSKKKKTKETIPTAQVLVLQNKLDSISYLIGNDIGVNLKESEIEINPEALNAGIKNAYAGNDSLISPEVTEKIMGEFQKEMIAKKEQKTTVQTTFEKAKGLAFLAENKAKPGVIELPSGLQYKIISEGAGENPTGEDTVEVHYTGTLTDGTVFDSSVQRGETITFPVNGVIPGWSEGLQLMKPGAKYMLYIPSTLAYGDRGAGPIPGGATLVFEVELISVTKK